MSEARFDLVILHHTSDKTVENLVQELLTLLDKVGDAYLEYKLSEALLFDQSSSAILDDIDEEKGKAIQEQFRKLSVETELRPTLQLVSKQEMDSGQDAKQYVCPSCNYTQPKQTNEAVMDTCDKCGVVGAKLEESQKKEAIYQAEKRRLEQTQSQQMREAVERARYKEEEALRKEARERLGVKDKNRVTNIAVGIAVVGAMGVASFFIADILRNNKDNEVLEQNITQDKTDTKEQKPLITIQAGNGSITINNAPAAGNGGAKGTTGGATSTAGNGSNGSFDTVSMSNQQHAQGNGQNFVEADSATTHQAVQLAAASANKNQIVARELLAKTSTTPDELETLKVILNAGKTMPELFFTKIDAAQFQKHKDRMRRLLTLGKPGLALVFAEGIDDPYPASLMVLEIAKHEIDSQNVALHDDILLTMKNLAAMGNSIQSNAMLKANLSQAYAFTGDKVAAFALLKESIKQLNSEEISTEQRYQSLVQIETDHRQLGNQEGADFAANALREYADRLPAKEYTHINRAYTHLAAASLTGHNPDDANSWLHKIPVPDARKFLLTQLETIKKK